MSNNENTTKPKTWQLVQDIKNMELEIDAHKQIERVLKSREDRFKTIFFQAPVAYFLIDFNGNFIDGNLASYQLTGYSTEELFGKNFIEMNLIDKKNQKIVSEILSRSGNGEYTGPDEFSMKKKDGSFATIEIMTSPVTINNQKLTLGSAHDITNRKLMQTKLQASEDRFRKLFESTHDALMTLNPPTWKFTSGNPAILKMFNVKNIEEFLTYCPWDVSPKNQPDGRLSSEKAKEMIEMAMTKGSNYFEWTHKRISGEPFPVTVLLTKIQLKDESFLQASIRDITEQKQAEDALRKSEKKYRDLFEKSKDAILIISNGKFMDCNQSTINMLRYKNKKEFLNTHPSELSPEKQPDGRLSFNKANEMMNLAYKNGSHRFEWDHKRSNGEVFPVEVLLTAISTDNDNKILHTVWRDITERKLAELDIKQSEERFKRLFDDLGDAVFVTKLGGANRGQILEINRAAESQTGYTRKELLKMNIIKDIYIAGSGETKADDWEEKLNQGETVNTIERKRKKDGTEFWTEVVVTSILFKGENAGLSINHDITERKQKEKALRENDALLKSILDSTGDGLLVVDDKGQVTHRNNEFNTMWRIPQKLKDTIDDNKLIDFVLSQLVNPSQFIAKVTELYNSSQSDLDTISFKDGRLFERYSKPLVDGNSIKGRVWSFRDITDRMQAAKALKKNEEKYHSLTENLQIGIYRNTPGTKGKFIEVNKAMIDMFGFKDRESMLATSTSSLYVSPHTRKLFSDKLYEKGTVKNEEIRLLRKDGNTFIGSITATAVKDEDGTVIHYDGLVEDITERAELRMKLQENEEKFRSIVHNSPCIIIQADRQGIISFINYKYSGLEPENIIGNSIYDLMPPEYHDDAKATIRNVFDSGESYSFESIGLATGENAVWYKNTISAIRKNDKVVGIAILAVDISEQKQTDIMKTEFISSVSHELRTPLTIIRESLSLLSDGLFGKLNKDQADIVNPAMEDVDRLGRIINNLLDISKIDGQKIKIEREMVDIVKLARGVVKSFENQVANKNIELVLISNQESIIIYLDRDRIIQVFMNLIGNSAKFTREGKIEIIITEKENTVECCIADTGKGINTKDLGTIFDRFHQVGKVVKAGEKGSGLGLSISKGIVKLHHGKIWVNSKLDKGSKFYFALPKYSPDEIIIENIDKGIDAASKKHIKLSLLLVRVDNLSEIDKVYNNGEGNKIIADILRAFQDTLAPGEFSFINSKNEIVLFSDITAQNISIIGSKLEDMFEKSLAKPGIETNVELSSGYSIYPSDADNASDLIEAANENMKKQ